MTAGLQGLVEGLVEKLGRRAEAAEDRADRLLGLLTEARDMMCEHVGAVALGGRTWCVDCSSYLRGEAEHTLNRRIDKELGR